MKYIRTSLETIKQQQQRQLSSSYEQQRHVHPYPPYTVEPWERIPHQRQHQLRYNRPTTSVTDYTTQHPMPPPILPPTIVTTSGLWFKENRKPRTLSDTTLATLASIPRHHPYQEPVNSTVQVRPASYPPPSPSPSQRKEQEVRYIVTRWGVHLASIYSEC